MRKSKTLLLQALIGLLLQLKHAYATGFWLNRIPLMGVEPHHGA
jgi:hypothetical protein